jgi:hypothetical protein
MKEIDHDLDEVVYNLSTDVGNTLRAGQDVAYVFAVTEEGVIAQRRAAGEDAADIEALVVTEDGVVVGQAVATEEGVAYEVAAATEDEVAYEAGVATEEGAVVVDAYATAEGEETPVEDTGDEDVKAE